jgi:hypothetical protein
VTSGADREVHVALTQWGEAVILMVARLSRCGAAFGVRGRPRPSSRNEMTGCAAIVIAYGAKTDPPPLLMSFAHDDSTPSRGRLVLARASPAVLTFGHGGARRPFRP